MSKNNYINKKTERRNTIKEYNKIRMISKQRKAIYKTRKNNTTKMSVNNKIYRQNATNRTVEKQN